MGEERTVGVVVFGCGNVDRSLLDVALLQHWQSNKNAMHIYIAMVSYPPPWADPKRQNPIEKEDRCKGEHSKVPPPLPRGVDNRPQTNRLKQIQNYRGISSRERLPYATINLQSPTPHLDKDHYQPDPPTDLAFRHHSTIPSDAEPQSPSTAPHPPTRDPPAPYSKYHSKRSTDSVVRARRPSGRRRHWVRELVVVDYSSAMIVAMRGRRRFCRGDRRGGRVNLRGLRRTKRGRVGIRPWTY